MGSGENRNGCGGEIVWVT